MLPTRLVPHLLTMVYASSAMAMLTVASLGMVSATSCTLHIVDAMHKVTHNSAPSPLRRPVAAARGELIHVQAVLASLPGSVSAKVIAQVNAPHLPGAMPAQVRQVMYTQLAQVFAPAATPGFYPDALVPPEDTQSQESGNFSINRAGWPADVFWISYRVPSGIAPGTMVGTVSAFVATPGGAASGGEGSPRGSRVPATCGATFGIRVANWTIPATPTELTGAQFEAGDILPFYAAPTTHVDPQTAVNFFRSMARQRVTASPWFQLSSLPWAPTYRFNANRTRVVLNTTAHDEWWGKVLQLTAPGPSPWRMPFSSRFSRAENAIPHFLNDNVTWWFQDENGDALKVPVFAGPPYNGTLNPAFEQMFTVLFTAVVEYLDTGAAVDWPGGPEAGMWVQIIDEPTWDDPATLANTLAIMHLYKRVSPRIKLYQTRFPQSPGTSKAIPPAQLPLLDLVDWWYVVHVDHTLYAWGVSWGSASSFV